MRELLFKNESQEAKRAQQLLDDRFLEEFAKVPAGWDFALDLDTLQTYSAESPIQIREKAASRERIVTLALKTKGRDDWPWRIVRLDPRAMQLLNDFLSGKTGAFACAATGVEEFQAVMFRKVDDLTRAVILADSVDKLRALNPHPSCEIRRVTIADIESFIKRSGGRWVIEMLT